MWRIIIRDEAGAVIGQCELDEAAGSIVVGRGDTCHLVIDDPAVSREHAYFYISEGEVVVEDAGSALGVTVNDYAADGPMYVGPEDHVYIDRYAVMVVPADVGDESSVAVDSSFVADAAAAGAPAVIDEEDFRPEMAGFDPTLKPQGGMLKLVAVSGLDAGSEVPLEFPEDFDVGRDADLEVAVMDPTVSRRHARLRQTDRGVLVIDLRSMNGTFINGEKVKREEASRGDRLRFGEVAYELQAATAKDLQKAEKPKLKLTRKHLILMGGGGIFVIALIMMAVMTSKPPARKKQGSEVQTTSTDSRLQRKFRKTLSEARTLMRKRQWQKAKDLLLTTKNIFARHETRDGELNQCNEEMQHAVILKRANALYAGGTNLQNYTKARSQYRLIKPTSDYFGEAQLKLDKVDLWLAKYYLTEGLTYAESRRTKNRLKAAKYLCTYFDLLPEYSKAGGNLEKHRSTLKRLEKKLRRVKRYEKCSARRFLSVGPVTTTGSGKVDPLSELRKQHQVERLVQVLMLYFKGNLDESINRLRKLQDLRSMRKRRYMLSGVFNKLTFIKGKYSAGTSALQSGKLKAAQDAFDKALAKDAELIPPTLRSYVKNEIGRLLAEKYLTLGQTEYKRSRYEDAYMWWHKGKLANPTHVGILNSLLKLESVARNWVSAAASLVGSNKGEARAKYEAIRRITEPGSLYYTKATRALANLK